MNTQTEAALNPKAAFSLKAAELSPAASSITPAPEAAPRSYFTPFSEAPAAPEAAVAAAPKAARGSAALKPGPENETAAGGSARGGFVRFSIGE